MELPLLMLCMLFLGQLASSVTANCGEDNAYMCNRACFRMCKITSPYPQWKICRAKWLNPCGKRENDIFADVLTK